MSEEKETAEEQEEQDTEIVEVTEEEASSEQAEAESEETAHELSRPPVVDIDGILKPVSADAPAGEYLRYDGSYEEISDITGVNLGTVKSRLHRARNSFAQRIEPFLN